jgi:membrane protease YdiL (CAAX protease family)
VDKIPNKKPGICLILISSTFLAMWILALIPIPPSHFKPQTVDNIYIFSLYLFSFLIPAVGLLLFLNHIKKISSRWYWGVPLLFTVVLITLNRDNNILGPFYDTSFIVSYGEISDFLSNSFFKYSVSIVYCLSMLLFTMSVPRK